MRGRYRRNDAVTTIDGRKTYPRFRLENDEVRESDIDPGFLSADLDTAIEPFRNSAQGQATKGKACKFLLPVSRTE